MAGLFSEIYNRYFSVTNRILSLKGNISRKRITDIVKEYGFAESLLFLLPKLCDNEWELFDEEGGSFRSKIKNGILTPLSILQKRWLKTALADPRSGLFLDKEQIAAISEKLKDAAPLFNADDLHYFDRFSDGDDYGDAVYISCFRELLYAQKERIPVRISYLAKRGRRSTLTALVHRMEYSVKNDCFRVICLAKSKTALRKYILRLSRMTAVRRCDPDPYYDEDNVIPDMQRSIILTIRDERNALERAMLQFADYRKDTAQLDNGSYRCEIFYNNDDETELLIELLSFGPMIKVEGPDHFVSLIKKRLKMQKEYSKERKTS